MRKILMICATASIFAACNNGDKDLETKKDVITTDTSAMYRSNASTDTSTAVTTQPTPAPQIAPPATKTITRTRTVYVDRTPKTTTKNNVQQPAPNSQVNTVPQTNAGSAPTGGTGTNTSVGTNPSTTANTPATTQKKGWSNSTKDAVIGGAAGAVGGAIISKRKGAGAVIGGVIGAAGGYILGRKKDKARADTIK